MTKPGSLCPGATRCCRSTPRPRCKDSPTYATRILGDTFRSYVVRVATFRSCPGLWARAPDPPIWASPFPAQGAARALIAHVLRLCRCSLIRSWCAAAVCSGKRDPRIADRTARAPHRPARGAAVRDDQIHGAPSLGYGGATGMQAAWMYWHDGSATGAIAAAESAVR